MDGQMELPSVVMDIVNTIFTQAIDMCGDVITLFTSNPITLVPIGIGLLGSVAGVTGKVLRGGRRSR